jgi:hypothetical protein
MSKIYTGLLFSCQSNSHAAWLFIYYMSRPNLSTHTKKMIYIYNFAIAIIGIQGVKFFNGIQLY